MMKNNNSRSSRLGELALLFLKLGTTAFGGPAAHIAMMEDEVVRRRRWLTPEEFLDLVGAVNLIPGPNSTELAIHIGYRRAGFPGLFVAGACFIFPAAILVSVIAWMYGRYGQLPQTGGFLYGVKPVIIAVVVQALWGLGRTAVKSRVLLVLGASALFLNFLGVHELFVLFGAGILPALFRFWRAEKKKIVMGGLSLFMLPTTVPAAAAAVNAGSVPFSLWGLWLFFLKVGSVLFGSGYVLLAFLRADLVERLGWLTESQLLDAIAVGQVTPGPVFTTATFIGYLLGGWTGAGVATLGIFLPAFFFVAISGPLVPRLRRSPAAGAFLDGVNVASLALMAVVTLKLGAAALIDLLTIILFLVSAFLLIRLRVNSAWLVLGGGMVGLIFH